MAKKLRTIRLSERTWGQLEELPNWLRVENRTDVIERLVEKEYAIMQSQNERALAAYEIGQQIQVEHPNGEMQQAEITRFTAGDRGQIDGIIVRFEDGTWIEVPASRLELNGSGQ